MNSYSVRSREKKKAQEQERAQVAQASKSTIHGSPPWCVHYLIHTVVLTYPLSDDIFDYEDIPPPLPPSPWLVPAQIDNIETLELSSASLSPPPLCSPISRPRLLHIPSGNGAPADEPLSEWYPILSSIRNTVAHWMDEWGPIERWPMSISEEFTTAAREGKESDWLEDIRARSVYAKVLLARLGAFCIMPLPQQPDMLLDVWRQTFELGLALRVVTLCIDSHDYLPRPSRISSFIY